MDRKSLLSYKPKSTANKAKLIRSFDHSLPTEVNFAFRRPIGLRDLLVRARRKPDPIDDEPLGKYKPCGRSRCQTCKMITPSQTATSSSGDSVKLNVNANCRTQNVVYLISCGKCGKHVVAETKDALDIRMKGHGDDWRHKRFEMSLVMRKSAICTCENKDAVTAQLISAFVFAIRIVQSLYYLNPTQR